jgi:hypothetical protein
MLSVADFLGARDDASLGRWGGLPTGLALELVSNQQFNSEEPLILLVARCQRMWRELGAERASTRGLPSPEDLYLRATGCRMSTAFLIVVAIHAQALSHRFVRFPLDFFSTLGVSDDERDSFLSVVSARQEDLAQLVQDELEQFGLDWSFNSMRQFPLVRFSDDTFLVLSLRFLVERVFGIPLRVIQRGRELIE